MYYVDVTVEDLNILHEAMGILERLQREEPLKLYLYGLTQEPGIVDAAKEAIVAYTDEEGLSEEDIQLNQIAVMIQLSSDVLSYLVGSGLRLQKSDEFCYQGGPGEGIREIGWNWAQRGPTVTLGSFTKMALAEDGAWGDKFLQQYGDKQPMQKEVSRNSPATSAAPQVPPVQQPKQTSVPGSKKLYDLMENFLGE
jgi:hypothetical protein